MPDTVALLEELQGELELRLQMVGHRARDLMLHIAYLEPDFIPNQLVASLVEEPDDKRCRNVVEEL